MELSEGVGRVRGRRGLGFSGCANPYGPGRRAVGGGLTGAGTGAVIGVRPCSRRGGKQGWSAGTGNVISTITTEHHLIGDCPIAKRGAGEPAISPLRCFRFDCPVLLITAGGANLTLDNTEPKQPRLLRFARNDTAKGRHCEEPTGRRHAPPEDRLHDEAISRWGSMTGIGPYRHGFSIPGTRYCRLALVRMNKNYTPVSSCLAQSCSSS